LLGATPAVAKSPLPSDGLVKEEIIGCPNPLFHIGVGLDRDAVRPWDAALV
jgi:hypothetical protein